MGIFSALKGATLDNPDDSGFFNFFGGGTPTTTGIKVTPDTALTCSAVLSCIRVITEDLAKMPIVLYKRAGDSRERAVNHPIYKLLKRRPNHYQTPFEFKELMQSHVLLRGNAYAVIIRDNAGIPISLLPQDPDVVQMLETDGGEFFYDLGNGKGIAPSEDILHLRGLSKDGKLGLSLVKLMAESIGLSIATEKHGATFFGNGAHPGVTLKHPGKLSKEAKANIRKDWEDIHRGVDQANRVAVLAEGMEVYQLGLSNEDSQFLETRTFQRYEISGFLRVAPHLIGALDNATFSNIEHQQQFHASNALHPWCVRWEEKLNNSLLFEDEQDIYYFEYLIDSLVRADFKTRMEGYSVAIASKIMSPNEARRKENMSPYEGGDKYENPNITVTKDK
ncbi:phage portal protein [Shewanella surugensis]|uniref:Phage portal protein n=1 Tax=Shewanella surugensis TaxID=212020 RepID=A0ABT0LHD2_9GAMM|nr:phage portal protein [Shewanella surugensis]MCL1126717.1 phage portal protein [Shewanella surugensis]